MEINKVSLSMRKFSASKIFSTLRPNLSMRTTEKNLNDAKLHVGTHKFSDYLSAKATPKMEEYELSQMGVRAGKVVYPWKFLDSFWIVEGNRMNGVIVPSKILLTSKKNFMPLIIIPIGKDASVGEIHQALQNMLPEIPQAEPLPDRLMRKLGF